MMRFVKLVRDQLGLDLMGDGDSVVEYRQTDDGEHAYGLQKKLIEEVGEYLIDPSLDELADILEVVRALADRGHGVDLERLEIVAAEKRRRKGGFDAGVGMYVTQKGQVD